MNIGVRIRESERIESENAKILKHLNQIKPQIDVRRQLDDFKKSVKRKHMMKKNIDKFYVNPSSAQVQSSIPLQRRSEVAEDNSISVPSSSNRAGSRITLPKLPKINGG